MKALFKVRANIRNFCLGTQNPRQSAIKTSVWEDRGRTGLTILDSEPRAPLTPCRAGVGGSLPAGYLDANISPEQSSVFSVSETQLRSSLSRCQCLKEQWSLGKNTGPSFPTAVDLPGVTLMKLAVKQKSDSFDPQEVRTAFQVLPASSLACSSPCRLQEAARPSATQILPGLLPQHLPQLGHVCFSSVTKGTSSSCRTPVTKVIGSAGVRPVWVLVHSSSNLSLIPPIHHHLSRLPALLASGSR